MEVIQTGKYKGKSFQQILQNDPSYCEWVLNLPSPGWGIREFKQYLEPHRKILTTISPGTSIFASKLAQKLRWCTKFGSLLRKRKIFEKSYGTIDRNLIQFDVPASLYGQFIDYYMRYVLSQKLGIKFKDGRCALITARILRLGDEKQYPLCESYKDAQEGNATDIDILNCAICHSLAFKNTDDLRYINHDIQLQNDLRVGIHNYLDIQTQKKREILINPGLGMDHISADADMVFGGKIVDIKCVSKTQFEFEDFYQLHIYSALFEDIHHKYMSKLTIFDVFGMRELSISVSQEEIDSILDYLEEKELIRTLGRY